MNAYTRAALVIGFVFFGVSGYLHALFSTNLFEPFDILLMDRVPRDSLVQFDVTYEGAFHLRAFQAVEETGSMHARRCDTALQIWQSEQNLSTAFTFKKSPSVLQPPSDDMFSVFSTGSVGRGELGALNMGDFSRQSALRAHIFGDLKIPVNLMFAARFPVTGDWTLGLYLPFYVAQLSDVQWKVRDEDQQQEAEELLTRIEETGDMDLRNGWKRKGIGDFTALMTWFHDFIQNKSWLKKVMTGVRGGIIFPTGLKADTGKIFAFPFGYDGGAGILFGGTLEVDLKHWIWLGVDAQFEHFFGSKRKRRVMTDTRQTDLVFVNNVSTFKEPGFTQHYTLYVKCAEMWRCISALLAYQHTKHQDDHITFCNSMFSSRIASNAESMQEWTTHSLVGMLTVDVRDFNWFAPIPAVSVFAKYGFHGHRALLFDTVGVQMSLDF